MDLDDELCLCFHVTLRKMPSFIRVEEPHRAGQLSECFGAGPGCGWCRRFLEQLFEQAQARNTSGARFPTSGDYARDRSDYVRQGGGTPPPGATPIDPPF